MACTIDHLRVSQRLRVLQDFVDARGNRHAAGECGLLQRLEADFATQEILMEWDRQGLREIMIFRLTDRTGPGNGRMRQYFEAEELPPTPPPGHRFLEGLGLVDVRPPRIPEVTPGPIREPERTAEALERVWALAARRRFEEAEDQLRRVARSHSSGMDLTDGLAAEVCRFARAHLFDPDPTVFHWLRDRGVQLWYTWGSGATSGGEGAVRAVQIRAAEAEIAAWERARSELIHSLPPLPPGGH